MFEAERDEDFCLCWTLGSSWPSSPPAQIAFQVSLLLLSALPVQPSLFIPHPSLPLRKVAFPSNQVGTSLVVQWLRTHTSTAGGMGSISGQGTKVPHAAGFGQNNNNTHTHTYTHTHNPPSKPSQTLVTRSSTNSESCPHNWSYGPCWELGLR